MRKWFILFIISILPYVAHADAVQIGSLWYNLDESAKTAEVTTSGGDVYSGEIVIPSSFEYNEVTYTVTSIGNSAFSDASISKVTFPSSLTEICDYAFQSCSNLLLDNLPNTLVSIGVSAFNNCPRISKIILPKGLKSIGRTAFYSCVNLKKVELPSSLTDIGAGAFGSCGILSSVVSHMSSPIRIEESVFSNLLVNGVYKSSVIIYVPIGTKSQYEAAGGWIVSADIIEGEPKEYSDGVLNYSYVEGSNNAVVSTINSSDLEEVVIPAAITIDGVGYDINAIEAGAFKDCYSLRNVSFSEGLEKIGAYAFSGCRNVETVIFPSSIKSIWQYAFNDCGLTKLIIPEGCKSIGFCSFYECKNLRSVVLPSTLTEIGDDAFIICDKLSAVITKMESPYKISDNVFSPDWSSWESGVQVYPKPVAVLYVPIGTKSLYQAIDGWSLFADIIEDIPAEIYNDGLLYSYLSTTKTATVVGIENKERRVISIPSTISVGGDDYEVKSIGPAAFQYCSFDSLVIQTGIETIARNAFNDCYNLVDVAIPEGVTTIGESAFRNIGSWNSRPVKVVLPSTLTSIGSEAFAYINNLASVVSRIRTPFVINENVFRYNYESRYDDEKQKTVYTPSKATLYVPDGTSAKYKEFDGWNMFADIVEGELMESKFEDLYYSYIKGRGTATVIAGDYLNLRKVTVPSTAFLDGDSYNVKAVGAGAFQSCSLDTLVIGEGVETIEKYAFRWNYSLRSLTLPSSLKVIGEYSFDNCNGIKSLIIPQSVTTIGNNAFNYCNGLLKLELPASLDSIGDYAFYSCRSLSSVTSRIREPFTISENVFGVETWNEAQGTYTHEPSNSNLYVPEGTKAKYEAIKGWEMFANIYEGELHEVVIDSLKYAYLPGSGTAMVVSGDYEKLRKVTIPASITVDGSVYQVKEIGAGAFQERYNIESFTINASLETIGTQTFSGCHNATFSDLPASLKSIGDNAFWNCNGIVDLEIPEGVTTIGREAFAACYSMQKLILPSSLTDIGEGAFRWCNNLTTVTSRIRIPFAISQSVFCNGTNSEWDEDKQQYVTIYQPCGATLCVPEGTLTDYQRFEGWMMFADYVEGELREATVDGLAYIYNVSKKTATVTKGDNYSELRKVDIPANVIIEDVSCKVTGIASRAFSGTYITSVTIEDDGVETIGQEAFQSCSQLGTISLPSSLTSIGNGAFRDCYRLSSILIPANVNSIGLSAFAGCKALASIKVAEGNTVFESRDANAVIESATNTLLIACKKTVIPTGVTAIGTEAFVNLDIEEISIPGSVKTIGDNAFNSCHNLTEVVLPEGLETLGNAAFHSCSGLTLVELPKSLRTIGGWAFAECNSLTNVVSNIDEPKDIEYNTFGEYDNVYSQATLWVPRGKVSTYKRSEGWSRFKNFDELLYDNLTKPTISYNGRYLSMTNDTTQRAKIYYSTDGSAPTILYSDTIAISNLGTIQAISKRFGSYTVDTARYEITYVYDGVTARTANGGLLKNAFEWCGTDKIEMLDIDGVLNDEDFGTVRDLPNLTTLNMAASKLSTGGIPAEAFANTKMQWYVSPYSMTRVGANIFKGCQNLTAITWNSSSVELPEDVVTDVANPNILVYAKAQAMIPYALRNIVVNGVANNIVLVDSAGNNNFNCPEQFVARRITYTHDYLQQTSLDGETQGWETIALPFTVNKITHEKQGEITPIAVNGAAKPFWLYELGDDGLEAATQIRANVPYLICMPNNDGYGDEYILGGRVTFSAQNVTITTSNGTTVSNGDRKFVPTYQRVDSSADVYAMNVNLTVGENRMGSAFISNLREVRPFEAYSLHSGNRSRAISVSSLGGGDATGINDMMLKKDSESSNDVVKVYSLSGALIKQGKRDDVLRSLPKGLYIINGKKIIK